MGNDLPVPYYRSMRQSHLEIIWPWLTYIIASNNIPEKLKPESPWNYMTLTYLHIVSNTIPEKLKPESPWNDMTLTYLHIVSYSIPEKLKSESPWNYMTLTYLHIVSNSTPEKLVSHLEIIWPWPTYI